MSETSTLIGYQGRTISREELALVPTPAATETHLPVPHHEVCVVRKKRFFQPPASGRCASAGGVKSYSNQGCFFRTEVPVIHRRQKLRQMGKRPRVHK